MVLFLCPSSRDLKKLQTHEPNLTLSECLDSVLRSSLARLTENYLGLTFLLRTPQKDEKRR